MFTSVRRITSPPEIHILDTVEEATAALALWAGVWGYPPGQDLGVPVLRAVRHGGGYLAGAERDGGLVGASFGFLARHHGQECLHSHITGVVPGSQGAGVGRALKAHQRAWAAQQGLGLVTWTFDPLVRRNAHFNLNVLGATAQEYLADFYGPISDAINGGAPTDRLLAVWPTATVETAPAHARDKVVATPEDIVALRRNDPAAAHCWHEQVRAALCATLAEGRNLTGLSPDGWYLAP